LDDLSGVIASFRRECRNTSGDLVDKSSNPDAAQIEVTPNAHRHFSVCRFLEQFLDAAVRESP